MTNNKLIPPHGGYKKLLSYQSATVVYDFTAEFCKVYMSYKTNQSYRTYKTYESYMCDPEIAANCAICLIHQTNYLLDKQLVALERQFLEEGGFTERLYNARKSYRSISLNRTNSY